MKNILIIFAVIISFLDTNAAAVEVHCVDTKHPRPIAVYIISTSEDLIYAGIRISSWGYDTTPDTYEWEIQAPGSFLSYNRAVSPNTPLDSTLDVLAEFVSIWYNQADPQSAHEIAGYGHNCQARSLP